MPGPLALGEPRRAANRPVLAAWLVVATLTTFPYVLAALAPPAGRTFAGTFHWIDDFYNYVSFVQQAEDGRVVFENKLLLEPHPPVLVNLEWTAVGWISRALGRRPFLAYRVFSLVALAGFLLAVDRALGRLGLPSDRRFPALLLVCLGGGLGGLLFEFTDRPVFRCADLSIPLYPFLAVMANPHWLTATWLLLESILAFAHASGSRGFWRAAAFGTALGLVRPYDLALLVGIQALAVPLSTGPAQWVRGWLPIVGLAPVLAYCCWVFYGIPTFASYSTTPYAMPPLADLALALGPVALVAILGMRSRAEGETQKALRLRLLLWTALALLVMVVQPVTFSLQFVVGAGLPLLLLACLEMASRPPWMAGLVLALSSTAFIALRVMLQSEPHWHVPKERRDAAIAMRATCRPNDVMFGPPDIGLYTIGLTACRAYVSHSWGPDFTVRQAEVRDFYGTASSEARSALLDRVGATHLVLPGDAGPTADGWLGAESAFRQVARLGPPPGLSIYVRAVGCCAAPP